MTLTGMRAVTGQMNRFKAKTCQRRRKVINRNDDKKLIFKKKEENPMKTHSMTTMTIMTITLLPNKNLSQKRMQVLLRLKQPLLVSLWELSSQNLSNRRSSKKNRNVLKFKNLLRVTTMMKVKMMHLPFKQLD